MSDIWAEFTPAPSRQPAPQNDPWAEFTPAQSTGGVRTIPAQDGRPARVIMYMGGSRAEPASPQDGQPGVIEDSIRGFGGGLIRGAAGTVGLVTDTIPGWINDGLNFLEAKATGATPDEMQARITERRANSPLRQFSPQLADAARSIGQHLTRRGLQQDIESVTGPAYVPHTRAGKFASTAGEFVPGAMIPLGGQAGLVRNAVAFGVVPGLLSEAGGQAFEGSAAETPARIVGALAGGVGGALATRGNPAGKMIREAVGDITPQQLDAAEQLFQRAQQAGQPMSRAEAIQAVTQGSTRIGDLQHTVEGMGGMRDFYAARPAQNEAAARLAFDTLSPPSANPSQIGSQVGRAAENIVSDVTQAINRRTRPLYQAGEQQRVGPQVFNNYMANDPMFAQTLAEVRNTPALNRTVAHLPDDSVGVIDLVQRRMREQAGNARMPGQASTSNLAAANFEDARNPLIAAADAVTGSRPGAVGTYETARNTQQQLRQQYLEPLMSGPIGKLAGRDTTTRSAINALFPQNPLPNSADEILTSVSALAARIPQVARQLVRAHVESVFNEASQRMAQGGFNQSGGAKFAAVLRGNPQQADNLEAAVVAMSPHGRRIWQGFNEFLENLEAQQYRQATGSRTAFKAPGVEDMKSGGLANNAAQIVGSGGLRLPRKVADAIANWNIGRNLDDLARLLTDPAAASQFRAIATAPRGSSKALALTARLAVMANSGARVESRPGIAATR